MLEGALQFSGRVLPPRDGPHPLSDLLLGEGLLARGFLQVLAPLPQGLRGRLELPATGLELEALLCEAGLLLGDGFLPPLQSLRPAGRRQLLVVHLLEVLLVVLTVSFELEPFGSDPEGLGLCALLQEDVPVAETLALGFEGCPLSPECTWGRGAASLYEGPCRRGLPKITSGSSSATGWRLELETPTPCTGATGPSGASMLGTAASDATMPFAATAGQEVAVGASGASALATAAFVTTASAAAASVAVAEASVAGPCSGTSS